MMDRRCFLRSTVGTGALAAASAFAPAARESKPNAAQLDKAAAAGLPTDADAFRGAREVGNG